MLFSGLVCNAVAFLGYYSKMSLIILSAVATAVLFLLILKKSSSAYIIAITSVMLVILSTVISHGKADSLLKYNDETVEADFVVTDVTYKSSEFSAADIEIKKCNSIKSGTKLSITYNDDNIKMGDYITGKLKLKDLNENSYKNLYYSKGIYLTASLKEYEIEENRKDFILSKIGNIRNYIKSTLFSNLKFSNASTVTALILGDDSYFTDEFYYYVKASGVSHVMVVSGMHLTILVLLVTKLVETFVYNRYFRALIMFSVVLFVIAVCGFTASMQRAGVTYLLMALALVFNRKGKPENTLGTAVTLILIFSPFAILNIGFQLSVLATFGILAVALPTLEYIKSRKIITNKLKHFIISSVIVTLSATILTLPVLIYAFGYISTVSIISNLMISYAVDLLIWLTVIGLVLNLLIPFLGSIVFIACEVLTYYINWTIKFFGALPFAVLNTPDFAVIISVAVIIAIFYVLLACKKRIDMLKLNEIYDKLKPKGGKLKNGDSF